MPFTLVSTQTIIARNAGALYGLEVGAANMASYVAAAGSNTDAFLNTVYGNSVGSASTASVADVLVANLGITGDAAAAAKSYIVGQLNSVAVSGRGAAINNMLSAFSNLTEDATFGAAAKAWNTKVGNAVTYAATAGTTDTSWANVSGTTTVGQTYVLTTGTDTFAGGAGADVFTANVSVVIDTVTGNAHNVDTAQAVDVLNGGDGIDTLNVVGKGGTLTLPSLTSVEVINASSLGALDINTASVSDVTNLNITKAAGAVTAKANAATNIAVALTEQAGATAANTVDGGNNVTVTATKQGEAGNADSIVIGGATAAKGDVVVTSTGAVYAAATTATIGNITVTGGKTISVTESATADITAADADTAAGTITQGNVTVNGNASTTAVTVKQDAKVAAANAVNTTGGASETASVKFGVLKAGDALTVAGLTFTASVDMTAAEVAATFAGLIKGAAYAAPALIAAGDTQGGGAASKGTYTLVAHDWTSAAASGDTVVFTSTTKNTNVQDLAITTTFTGSSVAPVVTTTDGKANNATATGGKLGVVTGVVHVTDNNNTIKTISIDGYHDTSSTTTTAVLETLNLSNGDTGATFTVADTADTFALNLSKVNGPVTITAAPATLNIKSTGANTAAVTAVASTALNVSGTGVLNATGSHLDAVKNVVVTESAGLTLTGSTLTALESVNAAATTGAVTATIDGTHTSFAGGAGADKLTLATGTALTKAIDMGAGDDTVTFSVAVTGSTAALNGGDGTDTLAMAVTEADALDGVKQSFYTNFERLTLTTAAGTDDATADNVTLNLDNLGFANYVTTAGTVVGTAGHPNDHLILDKMASGGTVVFTTAATLLQVNVVDAATGTADVLNAVLSSTTDLAAGTLTAANVETVNISTVDTEVVVAPAVQTKNVDTLTLTADKATTVNLTGGQDLALTLTGSTKVTLIDGSAMTGGLTVQSVNTTSATTIKGGSGSDVLTAAAGTTADVLLGGDGNDVLVANSGLDTLTGGAGNDAFVINTASLNSSSYATVTDFTAGDLLQFAGATSFKAAKIAQGDTAVFQDYANAAMNATGVGAVSWFQFNGNTYVVMDAGNDSTTFTNNEDLIVKLTGLVDLTGASFNSTYHTISL